MVLRVLSRSLKPPRQIRSPIELGGSNGASYAAYEGGKVFTVNYDGEVRAFEADTGPELWSMHLPSTMGAFYTALTALEGKIYITGGYDPAGGFVVSEASGALLWKKVYMGETSGTVAAVDEVTGVPVWSQNLGLGESINDGGDWHDAPRMGLAAGGGALLVPAHYYLAAFW